MKRDFDIKSFIPRGAENAIKNRDLSRLLCISPRDVYLLIERARNNGDLIVSSNKGYYQPEVDETGRLTEQGLAGLKLFYAVQRARGIGCLRSAKSARLAIKEYEGGEVK